MEIMMRHISPRYRRAHLAILSGVICACVPLPERYLNSAHPQYGNEEYIFDLAQCRNENSTVVVSILDYALLPATVGVNEVKAEGCMSRHGWEAAPSSVSW
jgi:hypothetical protein